MQPCLPVLAAVAFCGGVFLSSPSVAQGLPACGAYPAGAADHACLCPSGSGTVGSVWGSGPYTADSAICTAAVHAGAIGPGGGEVRMVTQPGQSAYAGSSRNGVTTSSWGSYGTSFAFVTIPASVAACGGYAPGQTLTCSCAPGAASGSVWGSGPYTADSAICAAAVHSGVIGPAGGTVTALPVPGLPGYRGTSRNGVTTSNWGSYGASFVFDGNAAN